MDRKKYKDTENKDKKETQSLPWIVDVHNIASDVYGVHLFCLYEMSIQLGP